MICRRVIIFSCMANTKLVHKFLFSLQMLVLGESVHHRQMGRPSEAMLVLLAVLRLMLPLTWVVACRKPKQQLPKRSITLIGNTMCLNVYGIEECPQGTPKYAQLQSDLKHVVSVLSKVENAILQSLLKTAIILGVHLGRFNPTQSLPRSALVKFIQISDVSSIPLKVTLVIHFMPDLANYRR